VVLKSFCIIMEIIFRGFSTAFDPADTPLGWGARPTLATGGSQTDPGPLGKDVVSRLDRVASGSAAYNALRTETA
jgi:hypothetical protein